MGGENTRDGGEVDRPPGQRVRTSGARPARGNPGSTCHQVSMNRVAGARPDSHLVRCGAAQFVACLSKSFVKHFIELSIERSIQFSIPFLGAPRDSAIRGAGRVRLYRAGDAALGRVGR